MYPFSTAPGTLAVSATQSLTQVWHCQPLQTQSWQPWLNLPSPGLPAAAPTYLLRSKAAAFPESCLYACTHGECGNHVSDGSVVLAAACDQRRSQLWFRDGPRWRNFDSDLCLDIVESRVLVRPGSLSSCFRHNFPFLSCDKFFLAAQPSLPVTVADSCPLYGFLSLHVVNCTVRQPGMCMTTRGSADYQEERCS